MGLGTLCMQRLYCLGGDFIEGLVSSNAKYLIQTVNTTVCMIPVTLPPLLGNHRYSVEILLIILRNKRPFYNSYSLPGSINSNISIHLSKS